MKHEVATTEGDPVRPPMAATMQEIGFCHIRISDGVNSRLQLSGLLAKLCKVTLQSRTK